MIQSKANHDSNNNTLKKYLKYYKLVVIKYLIAEIKVWLKLFKQLFSTTYTDIYRHILTLLQTNNFLCDKTTTLTFLLPVKPLHIQ